MLPVCSACQVSSVKHLGRTRSRVKLIYFVRDRLTTNSDPAVCLLALGNRPCKMVFAEGCSPHLRWTALGSYLHLSLIVFLANPPHRTRLSCHYGWCLWDKNKPPNLRPIGYSTFSMFNHRLNLVRCSLRTSKSASYSARSCKPSPPF